MYKKLNYIVITFLSLFLIASNVNAKTVATCVYKNDGFNMGDLKSIVVKVELQDGGSKPTLSVVKTNGQVADGRYKTTLTLKNYDVKYGASTTLKELLKKDTKKCPTQLLIANNGSNTSTTKNYSAYLHNSEASTSIKASLGDDVNAVMLPISNVLSNNNCSSKIKEYTTTLKNDSDDLDLDECKKDMDTCKIRLGLENRIKEYEENVSGCIAIGSITTSSTEYKNYKAAIEAVNEKIDRVNNNIDFDKKYTNTPKVTRCGTIDNIPVSIPRMTRGIYNLVKYLVPVILIFTGMFQLFKAAVANDEKEMHNNGRKLIKSIIAGVLILLVMAIVQFVFKLIPNNGKDEAVNNMGACISCFISDESACGSESVLK